MIVIMYSMDSCSGSHSQQPQLPPGFRFHPTDEELIVHYLKRKASSAPLPVAIIAEVDLYKFDPWELPSTQLYHTPLFLFLHSRKPTSQFDYCFAYEPLLRSNIFLFFFWLIFVCLGKATFGEQEWYFFSPRDRKYPNGARPNRAATSGYWKATGTDKPILASDGHHRVGVKKALVFYGGKPPKGVKTNWIMHEYRLADNSFNSSSKPPSLAADAGNKKNSLRVCMPSV